MTPNESQGRVRAADLSWRLYSTLDAVAAMGRDLGSAPDQEGHTRAVLRKARSALLRLVDFELSGFLLADEDSAEFSTQLCEPADGEAALNRAVDRLVCDGAFGWALHQSRPVLVEPDGTDSQYLLHALSTRRQTFGMFVGRLRPEEVVSEEAMRLVTISLQQASGLLEGARLYQELSATNEALEERLEARTEDLRVAKRQADAANAAKSDFLARMTHELRTPLNGIVAMSQLLLESELVPAQAERAEIIESCSHTLMRIVNDVLDLSRIEAGALTLEQSAFDLRREVDAVVSAAAPSAQQGKIALYGEIDPGLDEMVHGDPGRLRQVLSNLLAHALERSEGGEVSLRLVALARNDEGTLLEGWVHDSGPSLNGAERQQLLDSVNAPGSGEHRRFGSSRLGLPLCRELLRLMGGDIELRADSAGGNCCVFTLPLGRVQKSQPPQAPHILRDRGALLLCADARQREMLSRLLLQLGLDVQSFPALDDLRAHWPKSTRTERRHARFLVLADDDPADAEAFCGRLFDDGARPHLVHAAAPYTARRLQQALTRALGAITPEEAHSEVGQGLHVLVVDDNRINQIIVRQLLVRLGCEVSMCSDGAEAVEAVSQGSFDAVFMDCEMPGMDGFEATRRIRQFEAGPQRVVPIIALTAHALAGAELACRNAGMDDFLAKPVEPSALRTVLLRVRRRAQIDEGEPAAESAQQVPQGVPL